MDEPLEFRSGRQRLVVLAVLGAYFALFVVDVVLDVPRAGSVADLLIAALITPLSVYGLVGVASQRPVDPAGVAMWGAGLVAGVSVAYEGLAGFDIVPRVTAIEALGSLALLVALGLYVLRR